MQRGILPGQRGFLQDVGQGHGVSSNLFLTSLTQLSALLRIKSRRILGEIGRIHDHRSGRLTSVRNRIVLLLRSLIGHSATRDCSGVAIHVESPQSNSRSQETVVLI